jgi:hypothetical protein
MDNYHIVKDGNHWALKKEGATQATLTAPTKEDAIHKTQDFMKGKTASVKIHKEDGTIQEERTYPRSADPHRTTG